jgi:polysaccharide biosynthesis transport protein
MVRTPPMSTTSLSVPASGSPPHGTGQTLKEYLRVLWHRKWLVLVIVALVVGGVQLLTGRQEPVYKASARMEVPPPAPTLVGSALNQPAVTDTFLQAEAEIIKSPLVTERVADDLGLDVDPAGLIRRIDAQVRPGVNIMTISATASTARFAADLTNSVVEQYLAYRFERDHGSIEEIRASLQATIQQNNQKIRELQAEFEAAAEAAAESETPLPEDPTINQRLLSLLNENTDARRRLGDLRGIDRGLESAGQALDEARPPSRPVSPDKVRNGILGGILGLVLGAVAAFVLESFRDNLSSPEEVEAVIGAPALALVPMVGRSHRDHMLLSDDESPGALMESFRTLRTNLLYQAKRDGFKTLVVTSPSPGDGKTVTATNLAVALSQVGHRVVLVDGDLRRPRINRIFGFQQDGSGLTTLLEGEGSIQSVILDPHIANLRLIGSGPVPEQPTELLSGVSMARVVLDCEEASDFVIFDSPPAIGLADSSAIAAHADGVLLVISQDAGRRILNQTRDQLRKAGAKVIGVVVNKVEATRRGYYYYDYYYPYYGKDENGGARRRRGEKATSANRAES